MTVFSCYVCLLFRLVLLIYGSMLNLDVMLLYDDALLFLTISCRFRYGSLLIVFAFLLYIFMGYCCCIYVSCFLMTSYVTVTIESSRQVKICGCRANNDRPGGRAVCLLFCRANNISLSYLAGCRAECYLAGCRAECYLPGRQAPAGQVTIGPADMKISNVSCNIKSTDSELRDFVPHSGNKFTDCQQ